MAVSSNYLEYVLEQLSGVGRVSAKRMFGGAGIYLDGLFFALVADDVLYFKVDAANQRDYEARGMQAFKPFGESSYNMRYFEVPIDVLEDRDQLRQWAIKALAVAKSKRTVNKKKAKSRRA